MAYTLSLSDGTTSLNLAGSTYTLLQGGLAAPAPRKRQAWAGASLLRHGADLVEEQYENRVVSLRLRIKGTTMDTLRTAVQDLAALLERASEFSRNGLGAQVTLTAQWDGASYSTIFDVITGVIDLPDDTWQKPLLDQFYILGATLSLWCKPFARGAQESIENYVADPSFEVAGTALNDWTETITATGSTARSTAAAKYGSASLLLTMTNSGGSGEKVERSQTLNDVDAAEVWSYSVWVRIDALSSAKVVFEVDYTGGAPDITTESTTVDATAFAKLTLSNRTAPAGTTAAVIRVRIESTGAGGSGSVYVDGVLAVQAASLPVAWASGHTVANHNDDDGQSHLNYLDLLDVPGDAPAALKVYADEQQAGTTLRAGVRHAGEYDDAGLYHEGESFATWPDADVADATSSDGFYALHNGATSAMSISAAAPDVKTKTIAAPPPGMYRVMARAHYNAATVYLGVGYTYGGVTVDPSVAADYQTLTTGMAWHDLGVLSLPPFVVPDGETTPSLTLRIAHYGAVAGSSSLRLDCVMLLPINRGSLFGSKTSAQDKWLSDSISARPGLWVLDRSNDTVKAIPTWLGGPPVAHPKGTRLYFLGSATIGDTWNVKLTYEPRFLHVR